MILFFIFIAVCESCVHGVCTAPNNCTCLHGYTGATCNTCEYNDSYS